MFFRKFVNNRNRKKVFVNRLVYLGLSMLEVSKMIMYEFWYYYVKPN